MVLLVPAARPARAQVTGELKGVVVADSGVSLPGVPVLAMSGGESRSTITGASGRFRFAGLPPGDYRVTVTGGAPRGMRVKVELARTVTVLMTSTLRRPAPESSLATALAKPGDPPATALKP
jgi:hypothetical protein